MTWPERIVLYADGLTTKGVLMVVLFAFWFGGMLGAIFVGQ